jgi:anthranilate/para-aminobenzoate synthase component I
MHIVSNVEGEVRADVDIVSALAAGFPAGAVSGAPKVRAMEIIDELENPQPNAICSRVRASRFGQKTVAIVIVRTRIAGPRLLGYARLEHRSGDSPS